MFPFGGLVRLSVPSAGAAGRLRRRAAQADQPLLHVEGMGRRSPGRTSTAEAIGELLV